MFDDMVTHLSLDLIVVFMVLSFLMAIKAKNSYMYMKMNFIVTGVISF